MANVNAIKLSGAAASSHPNISAVGTDTDINVTLVPKGSGVVAFAAALAGSAAGSLPLKLATATITPGSDADVTLSAAQYSCPVLTLANGSWTSGHNIIVPTTTGLYVVINGGSYTATVKTASGTGIGVATGTTQILWCDGVNVIALTAAV